MALRLTRQKYLFLIVRERELILKLWKQLLVRGKAHMIQVPYIVFLNINRMMNQKNSVPSGDIELTEVDMQINAEIMRRLLVFLGMQDLEAKKTIEKPQVIVKAKLSK